MTTYMSNLQQEKPDITLYISRDNLRAMLRQGECCYFRAGGYLIKVGEAEAMHKSDAYWEERSKRHGS